MEVDGYVINNQVAKNVLLHGCGETRSPCSHCRPDAKIGFRRARSMKQDADIPERRFHGEEEKASAGDICENKTSELLFLSDS